MAKNNNAVVGMLAIGAVLMLARGRVPAKLEEVEHPPPGKENGFGVITNLQLDVLNPLEKRPGDIMSVGTVRFNYRGPAQKLTLAWGIKPSQGLLGAIFPGGEVDFDDGENLIASPVKAWAYETIRTVPATNNFIGVFHDFMALRGYQGTGRDSGVGAAPVTIPNPDRDQHGADGRKLGLNYGDTDVWVWIVGSHRQPSQPTAVTILNEDDMLAFEKVPNVFDIVRPTIEELEDIDISFL